MIANYLPAKVRRVIYIVLGALLAVEGVLDLVPAGVESQTVAVLGALGFAVAQSLTRDTPEG